MSDSSRCKCLDQTDRQTPSPAPPPPCRASHASLAAMWGMYQKEGELQQKCAQLEQQLSQTVPQSRGGILRSITAVGASQLTLPQSQPLATMDTY